MAVEAEVGLGGGEADEDGGVDVGGEHGGVEDAGDVEPLVADPDPLAGKTRSIPSRWAAAAPSTATGSCGGRGVEVAALGDAGADGVQQAEAGGVDGEGVGVDGGDEGLR